MSKVLIVDDYKDATETLALIVRSWGFECRTVYDGPSALELAATFQPDAVLLDLGMPELDGWEVATRLRGLPHHALILAISGYGRQEDVERCREVGMDGHFLKPIDPSKLRSVLSERLQATSS